MGFQAFLAETVLGLRQPLTLLHFRQWVIKKGVRNRSCVGLEHHGLFLAYMPIIYAFLSDNQQR